MLLEKHFCTFAVQRTSSNNKKKKQNRVRKNVFEDKSYDNQMHILTGLKVNGQQLILMSTYNKFTMTIMI